MAAEWGGRRALEVTLCDFKWRGDVKMKRLTARLEAQLAEGATLDAETRKNLRDLGYGR